MFCLSADLRASVACDRLAPYYALTSAEYQALQQQTSAAIPPLKATDVASVFATSFSIVVLFFLFGRGLGSVLSLIRRG